MTVHPQAGTILEPREFTRSEANSEYYSGLGAKAHFPAGAPGSVRHHTGNRTPKKNKKEIQHF